MSTAVSDLVYEMQNAARALEIAAYQQRLPRDFTMNVLERQIIIAALDRNKGNHCRAAKALGCHRNTLYRRMHDLNIPGKREKL